MQQVLSNNPVLVERPVGLAYFNNLSQVVQQVSNIFALIKKMLACGEKG